MAFVPTMALAPTMTFAPTMALVPTMAGLALCMSRVHQCDFLRARDDQWMWTILQAPSEC